MPDEYNSSERKSNFSNYMYAARRRQKSVRGKFQFGKLCIGQQLQLFAGQAVDLHDLLAAVPLAGGYDFIPA